MFDKICLLLTIIGSLNWGLVGLFKFDFVAWLFGGTDDYQPYRIYDIALAESGVSLLFREHALSGCGLT